MKTYTQFVREAKGKTAVVTFGRMNPPTIGHQKLVDEVLRVAKQNGATPHVFVSHTQKKPKDPLDYNTKVAIAGKAFGKVVQKDKANNPFDVVYKMRDEGYDTVFFVAGSDRVPQYNAMFKKYSGHPDPEKDIGVELQVVSAGERDPDADGAEGMSASKMRALAMENDYANFMLGAPEKLREPDVKKMFVAVRKAMGAK
tara:strand:- start:35 stop:631 length:597 start_codon:yes stop_codon:yes gene_type:complete